MDNDQHVDTASRTPTIREELEGFVRSLFSPPEAESAPRLIAPPPPPPPPAPPAPQTPPSPEALPDPEKQQTKTNRRGGGARAGGGVVGELFQAPGTVVVSQ